MDLNELKQYGALMKELGLSAFEVKDGNKTFRMERAFTSQAAPSSAVATEPVKSEEEKSTNENLAQIKSPMVGVFYSSSAEDKEDYVKVGSEFRKGDTICIIEAMKLMNEIKAEDDGFIEKILVKSGSNVEYGTPLFLYRRAK